MTHLHKIMLRHRIHTQHRLKLHFRLVTKGEVRRQAVLGLGTHLRGLQYRVTESITEKVKVVPSLEEKRNHISTIKIPDITEKVESAFREFQENTKIQEKEQKIKNLLQL